MKVGGQILWNVTPICETSQIYYLMRRRPMKDVVGNHLKGPIIPFGSLVEYHPITVKDQSRVHQFGKKVLPGLFLGYALYAGGIWKGDVLVADLEELYVGRVRDSRENSRHPGQIIHGQKSGKQWERMPSCRRSKSGHMKSSIWRTHENCEGSISLTRRTEFKETIWILWRN